MFDINFKSSLGFDFSAYVYNLPLESDMFTCAQEYSGGRCEVWTRSAGIEVGASSKNPWESLISQGRKKQESSFVLF